MVTDDDWLRQLPLAVPYVIAVIGTATAVAAMFIVLSWLMNR